MFGLVHPVLLGIVREATNTNMQGCWSFTCCFTWTLGPSLKFGQLKSFFYWYYCGRFSSELAQLVLLCFSWGRSTHYSDRLHDFLVTIPRCCKDVYDSSFFPHTARLSNSLPIEGLPLTYDLSGFKSRIKRHLLAGVYKGYLQKLSGYITFGLKTYIFWNKYKMKWHRHPNYYLPLAYVYWYWNLMT